MATKIEVTTNDKHRESDEVMRPILIAVNQLCPRVKYIHVEWGLENTFMIKNDEEFMNYLDKIYDKFKQSKNWEICHSEI